MTPTYEEKFYRSDDGLSLYYRDYSSRKSSRALLCLPGLTRNSKDFADIAPHFVKWGYRVLSPDLRGRGQSGYDSDPENYNPAAYIKDIQALLKAEGLSKVVVIGTSLGGVIAMVMAKACPELLAGVVLNDVGPEADPRGIAHIGISLGKPRAFKTWAEAARAVQTYGAAAYPGFMQEDWLHAAEAVYKEDTQGRIVVDYDPALMAPFMKANKVDPPPDLWRFFEALAIIPTLAVRGALSNLLSESTFEAMKARKNDLQTTVIPNRGHIPLLTEPASLAALEPFLRKTAG